MNLLKITLLLTALFIFLGCSETDALSGNDTENIYTLEIAIPKNLHIDSVVVEQVSGDSIITTRYYDSEFSIIESDSSLSMVTIPIPTASLHNELPAIEYTGFSYDVAVVSDHKDYAVTQTMVDYHSKKGANDSANAVLFDSLFIDHMLLQGRDLSHQFYSAYRSKIDTDTTILITSLLDTLVSRGDAHAHTTLEAMLPPELDLQETVLNNPEVTNEQYAVFGKKKFHFKGSVIGNLLNVSHIDLQFLGASSIDTLHIETQLNSTNGLFTAQQVIDISRIMGPHEVTVLVYDLNEKVTGIYIDSIALDSEAHITFPHVDITNALPKVTLAKLTAGYINDTVHLEYQIVDRYNNRAGHTIEVQYGTGPFSVLEDTIVSFQLPSQPQNNVFVRLKVTDGDGNISLDSTQIIVVAGLPDVAFTTTPPVVDTHDSLYLEWNGTDKNGSIINYALSTNTMDWIDAGTDTSITIAPLTQVGMHAIYVRGVDDDSNVVFDSLMVEVLSGIPDVSVIVNNDTVTINDAITIETVARDTLGTIVSMAWKSGFVGSFVACTPDTAFNVVAPAQAAAHPFVIRTIDDDSVVVFDTVTVEVINDVPTVNIIIRMVNSTSFTGVFEAVVTEELGTIEGYLWDFDMDGVYDDSSKTLSTTSHVFPTFGTYQIMVIAIDDDGNKGANTATVKVAEIENFTGFTLYLNEEFSTPISMGPSSLTPAHPIWTWGDGAITGSYSRYTKNNISFGDSTMKLTLRDETIPSSNSLIQSEIIAEQLFSGGELRSNYNDFRYGIYKVRMKIPPVTHSTFNTFGAVRHSPGIGMREVYFDYVPNHDFNPGDILSGIINNTDIYPDTNISFDMAFATIYPGSGDNDYSELQDWSPNDGEWHTYTIQWLPDSVSWSIDDVLVRTYREDVANMEGNIVQIPDDYSTFLVNYWLPSFSQIPDESEFPLVAEFDWVRFYRWDQDALITPFHTPISISPLR
ncbi:MAG: family 16 glycosylhydrolase [Fibrobacterales bacterium]